MVTLRWFVVAAALAQAGCATIVPRSAQQLASAELQHVDEFRYQVPLPLAVTYRNTLAKARECWQQSTGIILSSTFFVEADAFDKDLGYARIAVRIDNLVPTVVTISPIDDGNTLVVARRMKMTGVHYASHKDLPHLRDWALGKPEPCRDRMLL